MAIRKKTSRKLATNRVHSMAIRKKTSRNSATNRVHSVSAHLTVEELAKAGSALKLDVYGRDGKLGELEIGRGSLFWTGRNRQKSKRIRWSAFAAMMDELAYPER